MIDQKYLAPVIHWNNRMWSERTRWSPWAHVTPAITEDLQRSRSKGEKLEREKKTTWARKACVLCYLCFHITTLGVHWHIVLFVTAIFVAFRSTSTKSCPRSLTPHHGLTALSTYALCTFSPWNHLNHEHSPDTNRLSDIVFTAYKITPSNTLG